MPRNLDTATSTEIGGRVVRPALFLSITFKTGTVYCSTLPFNFAWNGQTWLGTGSLGSVSTITEGTDVQAYGVSVTLSGIDPTLLADSLNDIKIGGAAVLYIGFFSDSGTLVTAPTCVFSGRVDKPEIVPGTDAVTISLNLESPMIRLQRGSFRRYTAADQHIDHPGDTGFDFVPQLNFMALRWGN